MTKDEKSADVKAEPIGALPVVILAGGLGTRLRSSVPDAPKALAPIAGKPFLSYLLHQLAGFGIRKVILSTGYRAAQIEETFGSSFDGMDLCYSPETEPLGTGGAVRHALAGLDFSRALVLNGDSFCSLDFNGFLNFHQTNDAELSLYLIRQDDTSRYGRVETGPVNQVISFSEKSACSGAGWINAGIYLLSRQVVNSIPAAGAISIEKQVFPSWIGRKMFGFKSEESTFIDIGTPESFVLAQRFFSGL